MGEEVGDSPHEPETEHISKAVAAHGMCSERVSLELPGRSQNKPLVHFDKEARLSKISRPTLAGS